MSKKVIFLENRPATVLEGKWGQIRLVLAHLLLFLLCMRYLFQGLLRVTWNTASDAIDQGAYLQLGLFMREGRAFTDGNRNPLYSAVLAVFARREWAFFTEAKLLSVLFGLVGLLAVFYLSRRLFGTGTALMSTLLLSTNDHYQMYASWVASEVLLLIFFFVAWYLVVTGFQDHRRWSWGGAVSGLAALTKGTGHLLPLAFLAAVLLGSGRRLIQRKSARIALAAYFVIYLAVISPMLIINVARFGNPLYNYNTTHAVWFDDWEDAYTVSRPPATAASYLQTHSLASLVARQSYGLRKIAEMWTVALLPHRFDLRSPGRGETFVCLVAVVLLSALVVWRGVARDADCRDTFAGGTVFTLVLCLMVYLSFSWYAQVILKARFLMPLNAIVYTGVLGLLSMCLDLPTLVAFRRTQAARTMGRIAWAGAACATIGYLTYGVSATIPQLRDPYQVDLDTGVPREDVLKWLVAQTEPGESVLWGPSHSLPLWKYEPRLEFIPIPTDVTSWPELEAYAREQEIRYWTLDTSTIGRRPALLDSYFGQHYEQIVFKELPPRWELVYTDRRFVFDYCVFRLYPEGRDPPPMLELSPTGIGPRIELMGYRTAVEDTPLGKGVDVALVWRAREPVDKNYKVFTHLLDAQGTLRSQHDSEPLYGFWPTAAWSPNQWVVDHHHLLLGQDTPAGNYRIAVGLYDEQTMERLPVVDLDTGLMQGDFLVLPATVQLPDPST